jgi:hypothetical protein
MGQKGFFDVERRESISAKGDPLETIKKIVPWEDFRTDIEAVTETKPEERKSNAVKFKIMVLIPKSLSQRKRSPTSAWGRSLFLTGKPPEHLGSADKWPNEVAEAAPEVAGPAELAEAAWLQLRVLHFVGSLPLHLLAGC